MWRKIISIISGIVVFFVLTGLVFWIFARLRIGPIANMMTAMVAFSEDENNAEKIFELHARMREMLLFMHYFVLPILSVLTGFLTAKISKTYGWLCAMVAVGVPIIITIGFSKHMFFILPTVLCILLAAGAGYITERLSARPKRSIKCRFP